MPLFDDISLWLQRYDAVIKIVLALAAPGGIWFWADKFRNRVRITIRQFTLAVVGPAARTVTFEIENVSSTLTSLEPIFVMTGFTPERAKQTYTFMLNGNDRQLPPHVSKQIVGIHNDQQNRIMLFLWYMTFTIRLTRGGTVRLRFRNAGFSPVGVLRFYWEQLWFVLLARVAA